MESAYSQVDYLIHVSQMQTKQMAFSTFSGPVMNYKVGRSHTDMGPVSLSVWSESGLDLGESVIRVTFGSGPSQSDSVLLEIRIQLDLKHLTQDRCNDNR